MKKLVVIFLFFSLSSLAQVNTDSLRSIWNNKQFEDTTRLNALYEMVVEGYLNSQPDSAYYFMIQLYNLADSLGLKTEMATALNTQGVACMIQGDFINALDYYKKSLVIKEEIKDTFGISNLLNNIGTIYMKQGDYASSIEYYNRSLSISELLNDKLGCAENLLNIGIIYQRLGNYNKALEYSKRCLVICEELNNKDGIALCYNNIGVVLCQMKQYDKALDYYFQVIAYQEEMSNYSGVAGALGNIGSVYNLKKNYTSAMYYQKRSFETFKKVGNKEGMSGALNNIGEIFNSIGKYDSLIFYCKNALEIAQNIGSPSCIENAARNLYNGYKEINDSKKALEMYELYVEIKDSLQSERNKNELIHQEYKFKYHQKHLTDSINNAKSFELERLKRIEEAERTRIQWIIIFGVFIFLTVILVIFLRFKSLSIRKEKELLLKEIKILKSSKVVRMVTSNDTAEKGHINKEKIDKAIDGVLNESDWKILCMLCENPIINNREISEKIALSFEGVRSSLKKMYRVFDIQNSTENQRIALVIEAIRISNT